MFTGIIETLGRITDIREEGTNRHFTLSSKITNELKIDQSVAHNGVCLTVVDIKGDNYTVTAIDETLSKTNLGTLSIGDNVNLERCMLADGRFDGHMVYGHVDTTGICIGKENREGSTIFTFEYESGHDRIIVEKGSITLSGISLTAFDVTDNEFKVAIIPYTLEHTNLKNVVKGDTINLEFDILGKYIRKILQ